MLHADCIAKRLGDRQVLTAATLKASRGSVTGLLGRMGEGKSTLMNICAGLETPDGGWIELDGIQYIRPRLHVLADRGMFYLADSGNLASSLTLKEHFEALKRRYPETRVDDGIESMKLGQLLDSRPGSMSGGERRRSEIGLALARAPKCLIADEPFRGLDPLVCEIVGSGLRRLAANGCAVVVSGHEVRALAPYLDSIVWLTSGTTELLGEPGEAWQNERFRREYLGPQAPQASSLR